MLIIGESINGTIPEVGQSISDRKDAFLRELARVQQDHGAHILDVNAGVAGGNEVEDLPWLVRTIQQEVSLPLMLDSASPEALKAALSIYQHKEPPFLNSISGEEEKWNKLFPLWVEAKCKGVVLCMDDRGIPHTVEDRLAIARELFNRLTGRGIPPEHIYFDPLVLSIATMPEAAVVTLETIRLLRSKFPCSHIICGVSNVSMGLPARRLINRTFLAMAISAGLDTLLVDVRDQAILSTVYAGNILANQDPYCQEYLHAYRQKKILT